MEIRGTANALHVTSLEELVCGSGVDDIVYYSVVESALREPGLHQFCGRDAVSERPFDGGRFNWWWRGWLSMPLQFVREGGGGVGASQSEVRFQTNAGDRKFDNVLTQITM